MRVMAEPIAWVHGGGEETRHRALERRRNALIDSQASLFIERMIDRGAVDFGP